MRKKGNTKIHKKYTTTNIFVANFARLFPYRMGTPNKKLQTTEVAYR